MQRPEKNLVTIYVAILILGMAYGLAISPLSRFLETQGFGDRLGSLATFFAGGISVMGLPAGLLVRRVSPKIMFVVACAGYAISAGLLPLATTYPAVAALRALDGAFSVAVWVSSETILLSRAPKKQKAAATSIYALALALGNVVGSLVARGIVPRFGTSSAYFIAGALGAVAGVVGLLFLSGGSMDAPESEQGRAQLTLGQIFWRVKLSCLSTFSFGYFQAATVVFLPLYLMRDKHLAFEDTLLVPALFAGGMMASVIFAARLGDRFGHLRAMRTMGFVGMLMCVFFVPAGVRELLFALIFVGGSSLASLSPVALAFQSHVVPSSDYGRAGGFYNLSYALGLLIGPNVTAWFFHEKGGTAMIYHFAAMWCFFVLMTVVFRRDDPRRHPPAAPSSRPAEV